MAAGNRQHAPSGSLRIIAGAWRRLQLPVAPVEGLRPTPDRVRETVFNWLGQDCTAWAVLDLFAGTGALGFEAASRGASSVRLVESNRLVASQLQKNREFLLSKWTADLGAAPKIQVEQGDALASLKRLATAGEQFDLLALDPPFHSDWLNKALPLVPAVLKPGGLVYIEWHEDLQAQLGQFDALRHLKAGQVHAHLFALPAV